MLRHFYASSFDLEQLKRTLPKIYRGTARDRADWLERYYLSSAYLDLQNNAEEVLAIYGITERDRDSCGEMNDCPEVIAEMIKRMDLRCDLASAVVSAEGANVIARWRDLARETRQATLFC
jgi:hypothetical protein